MSSKTDTRTSQMSFIEHLGELRVRILYIIIALLITSGIAFIFRIELFEFIHYPIKNIPEQKLQVLTLTEMFITYLKLSVITGVFISSPWILLQSWLFISPGLHTNEKQWLVPFVVLGSIFFIFGGVFSFYVVMPLGFDYLVQTVPEAILANFRVADYVSLVIRMLLAFGIVFELPLAMWVLSASGIFSPKTFSQFRKYWIIISVILAAFLTPPDPLTQIMMAIPLIVFFEVGLIGAKILYPKN